MIAALAESRSRGLHTIAMVGYDGGRVAVEGLADHVIVTRSEHIPRIQEAQASAYHVLRELVGKCSGRAGGRGGDGDDGHAPAHHDPLDLEQPPPPPSTNPPCHSAGQAREPRPRAHRGHGAGRGLPSVRVPARRRDGPGGPRAERLARSGGRGGGADRDGGALPRAIAGGGAAARERRAGHRGTARGARRARLLDPRQPGRRRAAGGRHARQRHLRRLPRRAVRPGRSPLPVPLHELHQLRTAVHHRARRPVRPAEHDDGRRSPCARPAAPSTRTRRTAASTHSRTRAPTAGRACGSCTRAAERSRTHARPIRSRRPRGRSVPGRSSRSRDSAASTSRAWRRTRTPSPSCARASTARTSRSR